MILYPAIDLKDGQAVRLLHGEMDSATVFNDSPAAQARAFQDAGAQWLHLVDLNGAFAGTPVNGAAVEAILAETSLPAQTKGVLGYGPNHAYQCTVLDVDDRTDLDAFQFVGANGRTIYYMKRCGNYFYPS